MIARSWLSPLNPGMFTGGIDSSPWNAGKAESVPACCARPGISDTKLWLLTLLMPKRAVIRKLGLKVWVSLATTLVSRETVCDVIDGRPTPCDGLRVSE